jgi:hypothetical protein
MKQIGLFREKEEEKIWNLFQISSLFPILDLSSPPILDGANLYAGKVPGRGAIGVILGE